MDGTVSAADVDIAARVMSNQSPYHAYAMTGAVCLASAAPVPGTVPASACREDRPANRIRSGYPKGTVNVGVERTGERDDVGIAWVSVGRHERLIMDGLVYHRPREE